VCAGSERAGRERSSARRPGYLHSAPHRVQEGITIGKGRRRRTPEGYTEPETIHDRHRPPGAPRAREKTSQKAQLESVHRHGTDKARKLGMEYKTGLPTRIRRGKPPSGPDEELRRRVAGLLEADPELRRYAINVEVSGGRLVLVGIVDSEAEKERAGTLVSCVTGADGVENNLTVRIT